MMNNARIVKASAAFGRLRGSIWDQSGIGPDTKLKVYRSVVLPKKVREKFRECHNLKPQPFPDTKRKRKPTNPNKHKSNKRTKSTKLGAFMRTEFLCVSVLRPGRKHLSIKVCGEQALVPDSVKGLDYVTENWSYLFTAVYGLTKGVISVKKLISCRVTLYKARLEWSYRLM